MAPSLSPRSRWACSGPPNPIPESATGARAEDQLRGGLEQAGLPDVGVRAFLEVRGTMVDGVYDIVTGDVKKLAGRPPRPLREALAAALSY